MLDLQIQDPCGFVTTILLTHFPGVAPIDVRFVGNGSCNMVYGARIDDQEVVVRLTDRNHRGGEHAKEAWCIERAAAAGVPGPVVIGVGAIGDVSYMVQEFIPGERGDGQSVDHNRIWRQLGDYAGRIHSIDACDFIEADSSSVDWAARKWAHYVDYGIASLTPRDHPIHLGVYSPNEQAEIRSIFRSLQRQVFRFGLFHGDLSTRNTIVGADGRITLFDWGCAGVGIVPHAELSTILTTMSAESSHFEAFLDGYGLSRADFAVLHPQIRTFRLLQAFDLVRWSLDRRPEELSDYVSRAAETWAEHKMRRSDLTE